MRLLPLPPIWGKPWKFYCDKNTKIKTDMWNTCFDILQDYTELQKIDWTTWERAVPSSAFSFRLILYCKAPENMFDMRGLVPQQLIKFLLSPSKTGQGASIFLKSTRRPRSMKNRYFSLCIVKVIRTHNDSPVSRELGSKGSVSQSFKLAATPLVLWLPGHSI